MKPKPKAETMWFAWSPEGWPVYESGRSTRKSCISALQQAKGFGLEGVWYPWEWSALKKLGYRVIRCRVTPLTKKARSK